MVTRERIADVLYAGIGAGLLERVPAARVDDLVETILKGVETRHLDRRILAGNGAGLRAMIGLPAGEWTDTADEAVKRGRAMCANTPTSNALQRQEYDDNRLAL